MSPIDGKTELYGILGSPVEHSLSPAIYNRFFAEFGLNKVYVPLEIAPEEFDAVFKSLRRLRFMGFNVTSPYKETVVPHLDRLEGAAAEIGCVNTILRSPDGWTGINTDGEGLCAWLQLALSVELSRTDVVVLGAGNAARAIFLALLEHRAKSVTVINRRYSKFEDPFFRRRAGLPGVAYLGVDRGLPADPLAGAGLVIHVTSYGLGGREEAQRPAFPMLGSLSKAAIVVDTNYAPGAGTAFLAEVPAGVASFDGRGMLLYLAREAFRAWTGKEPDLLPVSRALGLEARS